MTLNTGVVILIIILVLVSVVALAIGIGWAVFALAIKLFNELMEAFNDGK